ncbi:tRNA lysidine(34) synthetase TilS C-terminal domain-containing protein [Alysiella crassa]|uniref:tRNA lysidine(34) synthetase TilS C-terminal domain-containing protein n=1 Tax=Alysiella crassa TaxID=153491 RepID=UPI00366FEBEA
MQNHHVPPFLRPHYPVLVAENGEVLAVLNLVARHDVGGLPESEFLAQFLL